MISSSEITTELATALIELQAAYNQFDTKDTAEKLTRAYQINPTFHSYAPKIVRSIVRKQGMEHAQLQQLYQDLLHTDLQEDSPQLLFLCQILKYAIKRGGNLSILQLITIYDFINNEAIRGEILVALAHVVKKQTSEELTGDVQQRLRKLLASSPACAARDFLTTQLTLEVQTFTRSMAAPLIQHSKVQTEVVKQQHTTKITHQNQQSQEVKVCPIDAMSMLRKNQKSRLSIAGERVPAATEIAGDDQHWYNGTYYEVVNLYSIAKHNGRLKKKDKDIYLPSKLFNQQEHWLAYRALGSFFINRMICNIYSTISRRQNLPSNAINQLFLCIGNLKDLKVNIFGTDNASAIAEQINNMDLHLQKYEKDPRTPDIVLKIAKKMFSECIYNLQIGWFTSSANCRINRLAAIIDSELLAMKGEALTTVYNLARRNNSILSKTGIQIIEGCLCDSNRKIKNLAIKILSVLEKSNEINYRSLFSAYLSLLQEEQVDQQLIEEAICYIARQAEEAIRCKELINQQTISEILAVLESGKLADSCQLTCLDIIHSYLLHAFTVGLSPQQLKVLVSYLNASKNIETRDGSLKLILLTVEKNKALPIDVVATLVTSINNYENNSANLVIVILEKILNTIVLDFNYIAFKLHDHSVMEAKDGSICFEKRTKENASQESISTKTANIIELSLLANSIYKVNSKTLQHLVQALACRDKQTRIHAAKCLFLAATRQRLNELVDYVVLLELQSYLQDVVPDVAVYTTLFYVEGLYLHSLSAQPIPTSHMDYLSQLYVMDELRLGNANHTQDVNQKIIAIIQNEINKNAILSDQTIQIINQEILQRTDKQLLYLDMLNRYVIEHGHLIPPSTISLMESKLDLSESHQWALDILCGALRNGQIVGEKTLTYFAEMLCKSNNHALRQQILECLLRADINQDVPDVVFDVLELERAGQSLKQDSGNQEGILDEIARIVATGQCLPLNLFEIFFELEELSSKVLGILEHVVRNKQSLPLKLIDRLAVDFEPNNPLFITIYYCLVKNNQTLPDALLEKLESHFIHFNSSNILAIFLIQAQQGKRLSKALVEKMMAWALNSYELIINESMIDRINGELSSTAMRQACLGAIIVILQQFDGDTYADQAQQVFVRYLNASCESLIQTSIAGIKWLLSRKLLSTTSITQIIEYLTICRNNVVSQQLVNLLQQVELSDQQHAALKLLSLQVEDDSQYLEQCKALAVTGYLFLDNFSRIQQILARSEALRVSALTLLLNCINRQDIPADVIETISMIFVSSASAEVKQLAQQLLHSLGKTTPEKVAFQSILRPVFDTNAMLQAIKANQLSVESLIAYKQTVLTLADHEVVAITSALSGLMIQQPQLGYALQVMLLKCMVITAQSISDSSECQRVLLLNMDSAHARCRSLAFEGMKILHSRGFTNWKFMQKCAEIQARVKAATSHTIDNLDLLQTLTSLHFVCLPENQPLSVWPERLILSDWATRHKLSSNQKLMLYRHWGKANKKLSHPEQVMKKLHDLDELSYPELSEILRFLPHFPLADHLNELTEQESAYRQLRKIWLKEMLATKINLQEVDQHYVELLVSKMVALNIGVPEKILLSLNKPSYVIELQALLDFVAGHTITTLQIEEHSSLREMHESLEILLLSEPFKNKQKLPAIFRELLQNGWQFAELSHLVGICLTDAATFHREESLLHVLYLLSQYHITHDIYPKLLTIVAKDEHRNWVVEINHLMLEINFTRAGIVQSSSQLVASLSKINEDKGPENKEYSPSTLVTELIEHGLLTAMENIKSPVFKVAAGNELPIAEWNKEDILTWAKIARSTPNYFADEEHIIQAIAIGNRANFIVTGFKLTDTQIQSCLVALLRKKNRGRLLQVETGAGKTIIISIIAMIQALSDKSIDVITSSSVRAEEDARSQASFYQLFDLTVADNLDRSTYIKGLKPCYQRDIVYGEISQFQFDILRDEYSLLGTKAGRESELVILDEVDSIIIDDATKIAKLTSTVAGMDQLQPFYFFLWQRLLSLQNKFFEIDGKMYLFKGMLSRQGNKLVIHYLDGKDKKEILDVRAHIANGADISQFAKVVEGDLGEFLEQQLLQYFNELITDPTFQFPVNFTEFMEHQKSRWIKNALIGLSTFQEYVNYIVQQDLVKPVAFDSNGTVQHSTNWSDGLHQFLQLKHAVHLSSETYTTNFLSNIATIKRYGENVLGFTGTLGSVKARQMLTKTYQVDSINIPNIRESQFRQLPIVIAEDQDEWLDALCFETQHDIRKNRGVLIICNSIEHVRMIEQAMRAKHRSAVIKTYTLNGENQEKQIEKINAGEIIIATNLAGRGTHINPDAIEHSGGLSVLFSYIPENLRIQWQGFGRTCRQGRLGSGRMIVNKKDLRGYDLTRLMEWEKQRDELEEHYLDQFQAKDLVIIETKDELFGRFCKLIKEIRMVIRQQSHGLWRDVIDGVKALISDVAPSVYETTIVAAIEEQWAMFLKKIEENAVSRDAIVKEYEKFEELIRDEYRTHALLKNPNHHIVIANDLLMNESFFSSDASAEAMRHYEAAIKLDPKSCAAAYVGKARLIIKSRTGSAQQNYKQLAILNFIEAIKILSNEMAVLNLMQSLLQEQGLGPENDLIKQLSRRIYWLGSYLNSIESAIRTIKKSQRLITITEPTSLPAEDKDVSQQTLTYDELERDSQGQVSHALQINKSYSLQFNGLTMHYDSMTIDQASRTVNAAFKGEHKLDTNYQKISVGLSNVNLEDLQTFLSPHLIFRKLSKESALKHLQEKDSFLKNLFGRAEMVEIEILSGIKKGTKNKYSISDTLKLVKTLQADDHVTLSFVNANETVKSLTVELLELSSPVLIGKLDQIVAKTIDLKLTGNLKDLLIILQNPEIQDVELLEKHPSKIIATCYYREAAIRALQKMQGHPLSIKLRGLNHDFAKWIISKAEKLSIDASFHHISLPGSLPALSEGHSNVQFTQLSSDAMQLLIPRLREEDVDFSVCFDDLTSTEVTALIKKADLHQEDIEISAVKPLSRFPETATSSDVELIELSARGIEYVLEVNEQQPVPWRSICAVSMIAGVQIAAGIMLISSGFGAQIGLSVITEGTADLLIACRAYTSRHFAWTDYCKQKAVSLAISAVGLGWQTLQQASKGINIYTAVTEEAIEQTITRATINGRATLKLLTQTATETSINLRGLAFAHVGVSVAEAGVREGLNRLADNISHLCFEHHRPQIFLAVHNQVNAYFGSSQLNRLVKKMLAIDSLRHSSLLHMKIEHTVRESLDPKHSFWRRQWDSVGLPLCKGILSDPKFMSTPLSILNIGIRILGILNGLDQLVFVIGKVHSQLFETLSKLDQELLSMHHLLQEHCSINKESAVEIVKLLGEQQVLVDDNIDMNRLLTAEWGKCGEHKGKVIFFLQRLQQSMQTVDTSPNVMMISEAVTKHVIRAAETNLVAPVTSFAIAKGVNSLSHKMQDSFFRKELMDRMQKNTEELEALTLKTNPSAEEKVQLGRIKSELQDCEEQLKQPQLTVVSQISAASKRMTIACAQRNIAFFAQKTRANISEFTQEESKSQQIVDQYAEEVAQKKSAGLYDMMVLDTLYNTNIKIVYDPNYQLTQEDHDSQVTVVVFIRQKDDLGFCELGHWQLLGDTDEIQEADGDNNCGYEVFAKLTGKSVAELRNEASQAIRANPSDFHLAMEARQWLETEHPMEAYDLLFEGGKKHKHKKAMIDINSNLPTTDIYFITEPLEAWKTAHKYHHSLRHIAIIVNDPVKGLIRIELDRDGSYNNYLITPIDHVKQTNMFSDLNNKGVILHKMGEINNFSLEQVENWARECVRDYPKYGPGNYWWANLLYGKNKNCRGFVDYVAFRLFKYNPAKFADGINIGRFYENHSNDGGPVREFEHRIEKDFWSNVPYDRPILPKAAM